MKKNKTNKLTAFLLSLSFCVSAAAFAADAPSAAQNGADVTNTTPADASPTETATTAPTEDPLAPKLYERPTFIPKPTEAPTETPSEQPSQQPSENPSEKPSEEPSEQPSQQPENTVPAAAAALLGTAEETSSQAPAETAAPSETATSAPSETPTTEPTAEPTAAPTATPKPTAMPAKQSFTLKTLLKTTAPGSKYSKYYESDIKAVVLDIAADGSYTYGNEYSAYFDSTLMTERQLKNILAGYVTETLTELNTASDKKELSDILGNIRISIAPVAELKTTPVFEKKNAPEEPSSAPSAEPSSKPSDNPSEEPSSKPSEEPSAVPDNTPAEAGLTPAEERQTPSESPSQQPDKSDEETAEWYFFPEYAMITKVSAPTPSPTPTQKPSATQKPSSTSRPNSSSTSHGGGGYMIAGPGVSQSTQQTAGGFIDLDSVPWARTAITTLASKGILNGKGNGIFDPDSNVTRAEFAKIICTSFDIKTGSGTHTFADVSDGDWFAPYVKAAAERGIVNGVSDTEFSPNANITRQEMATMLYRAVCAANIALPSGTPRSFADEGSISDFAKESVLILSGAGVINGVSDTEFSPLSTATRAQAAAIIYQYFQAAGK